MEALVGTGEKVMDKHMACFIRDSMSMNLATVTAKRFELGARADEVARYGERLLGSKKYPTIPACIRAFGECYLLV